MTDVTASLPHEKLTRTTWVTEEEWHELLRESERLRGQIRTAEAFERSTAHLWEALRPISQTIRSPLLKVRGIDDLTVEERRLKVGQSGRGRR